MITVASLVAAGIGPTQARQFAEPLARACARFEINTPARLGGFIGQYRVETADFTKLEEVLYYTTAERIRAVFPSRVPDMQTAQRLVRNPQALANRVYANRYGNGPEASGDGWRHRGRGLPHLTFRDNYAEAALALGRPYLQQPDLVAMPEDACMVGAWYWHTRKLNVLADSGQWEAITAAVNGPAKLQKQLRAQYSEEAREAFA